MSADLSRPGHAGGVDGDVPGPGRVVALPVRRPSAAPGREVPGAREATQAAILRLDLHFTAADRAAFAAWASGTGHGYDRVRLERGVLEDGTWVSYALVYVPGQAWSSWGVTRRDGRVEVWRCATGRTVSHHARVADALASLPHATDRRRTLPSEAGQDGMRGGSRRHGMR